MRLGRKISTPVFMAGVIGAILGGFFLITTFAHAQTVSNSPQIILSQGQVDATSSYAYNGNLISYSAFMGNGWGGTIGSVVLSTGAWTQSGTATVPDATIIINQASTTNNAYYSDSSCTLTASSSANIVQVSDNFFQIQLTPSSQTNGGCTLNPNLYTAVRYSVDVEHLTNSYSASMVYGSVSNSLGWHWAYTYNSALDCGWSNTDPNSVACENSFYPMFTILGAGWTLVPTTTTSSLSLSGAAAFCDSQFGSSSSIASDIGSGLCTTIGYLFIPNQSSIQAFQSIPSQLANTFPFSWLAQIRGILNSSAASSSQNFVNLSINLGSSTDPIGITQPIAVISTSTLSTYMPDSVRNAAKDLLTATFWLAAAYFVYRSLQNIWQTS